MSLSLPEIARALGGQIRGNRVVAPGPGHSRRDRSLSIRLADATDGFVVKSFAGDPWEVCRDYVAAQLAFLMTTGVALANWTRRRSSAAPRPVAGLRSRSAERPSNGSGRPPRSGATPGIRAEPLLKPTCARAG